MSKTKLRQSIIKTFLEHGECTISELTHHTGFSRVSISAELNDLCDRNTVKKKNKSRAFGLNGNTAFVIYKLHEKDAECVCVSSNQAMFERSKLNFLYSLSYEDNVTFLSANIQKQASALKKNYDRVFLCVIYDKEINLSRIISKQFQIRKSRHELITHSTELSFKKETVAYIDTDTHFSCLCSGGISLGTPRFVDKKLSELFPSAFSLFAPDRLLIDIINKDDIEMDVLSFSNLSVSVSDMPLKLDEKQLIIDLLCE